MEKIGKYKIIDILGKGAMGIVYKGLDPDIDREVAIKTVHFDKAFQDTEQSESLKRFIREAQAAGRLDHPNITTVYDVLREENVTFIVMQYVDGSSLQELLASSKKITYENINDLFIKICSGLGYAHKKGIIHRDIKPANILIDKEMNPFIVDFGVARVETSTLTQTGTAMGTPSYMSPEQVQGKKIDARSDIFSLGVLLYEALTGKRPFSAESVTTIIYKIINEDPPDLVKIRKDVPPEYETVIHRALAKEPKERYQTCGEMAADLMQITQKSLETISMSVAGEDTGAFIQRKKKQKNILLIGAAAALAILLLGGGYAGHRLGWWSFSFLSRSTEEASIGETALPVETEIIPVQPEADSTEEVRSFLENKEFDQAVRLAEELLEKDPENQEIQGYLRTARVQLQEQQTTRILQQGIASFNRKQYSQSINQMRRVLERDADNAEAKRYIRLASEGIWRREINNIVEKQRKAEEEKDLLTLLSDMDSGVAEQKKSEAVLLFNSYDDIRSVISKVKVSFTDTTHAEVSFTHLLTGTSKQSGIKAVIFEGVRTWKMERMERNWKITEYK